MLPFPTSVSSFSRNRGLAEERKRKRLEALDAAEKELKKVQSRFVSKLKPLRGTDEIRVAVGKVIARSARSPRFDLTITDESLTFERNHAAIAKEAALDGFYVVQTIVPAQSMNGADTVSSYKSLSGVERAFRGIKGVDLAIRPIHPTPARGCAAISFFACSGPGNDATTFAAVTIRPLVTVISRNRLFCSWIQWLFRN